MSPELTLAIRAAREAGAIAMQHFENVEVEFKADDSPVTIADRQAEQHIRDTIGETFPSDSILGEEFGESLSTSERRWVIDPIDGTKSFVAGVPLFANLVALEVAGNAQVGVANFPALNETYWAEAGQGAYLNGKRIHVGGRTDLSRALVLCGSLESFRKTNRLDWFLDLSERVYAVRTWCDAYGHCLVARGSADIMLDPVVSVWDTCAASVIVTEAGGTFTNFSGAIGYEHGEAISTNRRLGEQVYF